MRRLLSSGDTQDATENLYNMIVKSTDNEDFIEQLRLQILTFEKNGFKLR